MLMPTPRDITPITSASFDPCLPDLFIDLSIHPSIPPSLPTFLSACVLTDLPSSFWLTLLFCLAVAVATVDNACIDVVPFVVSDLCGHALIISTHDMAITITAAHDHDSSSYSFCFYYSAVVFHYCVFFSPYYCISCLFDHRSTQNKGCDDNYTEGIRADRIVCLFHLSPSLFPIVLTIVRHIIN